MSSASKKPFRHLLALLVLALVVTACAGDNSGEPAAEGEGEGGDGEQVTLRFAWWGSDVRHGLTQEVIDQFQEEHPDITIQGEFTGWSEYWDRLATTVAGGDAPDIIQQDARYLREYAERGALLDLNDHVGDTLRTESLDEAVLASGEIDGALYGVPAGVNAFTVVADPTIYEQAGVEMPDDQTWSWDDYLSTAQAISEGTPDGVYGAQEFAYHDASFQLFARQRGEDLFNAEGDGLGFSPETMQEWWNIALEASQTGATPPPSESSEVQAGGIDLSLLGTGTGAMGHWWTNELTALTEMAGHDLQLLRYPGESQHEQPGMYFKPAMFFSAAASTDHPEEVATFLDYLVNESAAVETLLSDRGLPLNTDLREQVMDQLPETDQQVAAYLADLEDELVEPPPVPPTGAGEISVIIQRFTDEVLFERLTVEQAVEQFMTEAEAAIG